MIGLGRGVRIATVGGTEVHLHWSLPLLWLVVAMGAGPLLEREVGRPAGLALGAGAGVLLSASVLAHELGHTVVARRGGVPVPRITLWMLGGLSELGARLRTPGRTVAVAVAGPAVSAVLGAGFLGLATLADREGLRALALTLGWTGAINLVLAVFNLLPGAPLDGGRVVAGLVWLGSGSRGRGDLWASRSGTALGLLLAGVGGAELVTGRGGWLLLVGWFVLVSSVREGVMARAELAAVGRTVADVCEPLGAPVAGAVTVHGLRAMGGHGMCPVAGLGHDAVVDLDLAARGRPDEAVADYAVPVAGRILPAGTDLDEALDRIIALGPGPVLAAAPDGTVLGAVHLERLVSRGAPRSPTADRSQ